MVVLTSDFHGLLLSVVLASHGVECDARCCSVIILPPLRIDVVRS